MTKKLMIVDDHALSRHLVRQVAAMPQDTVLECGSAEEALKAVGIFKPDCVMMGVSRPVPGAFQAIKTIRETHPEVRVVAVSSFPEAGLRQAAAEAGAAGYVTTENLSELFLLAAPERLTLKPVRRLKPRRQTKVVLQPR
jgi:two-component system uhpT operon response regulator UhpA